MSDSLILIGKSGAMAARSALDVTAQNIANASNPDYARRTLSLAEVAAKGGIGMEPGAQLSGVRPDRVLRSNSTFLQGEARRTHGDLTRAGAELKGLTNAESAVEQAGIYPAIVEFEASLSRLASDPLDGAMRAAVHENGRVLAQTFAIATKGLDIAAEELGFNARAGVEQVNLLSAELARTNATMARARPGSTNMAVLHDQRDALLREMSGYTGVETTFDPIGRVTARTGGELLVQGIDHTPLTMAESADGTLSFAIGGTAVALSSGALPGSGQAITGINQLRTGLDDLAGKLIAVANGAQANGTAPDGSAGQPFFSGTGARDIALALSSGSGIATSPAGSAVGSRDIGNLQALRDGLADNGPADAANQLLFGLSSAIASRTVTRDALQSIADTADVALSEETGVDLDQEAANLIRYQQAFQASGRVIQTAAEIFDTLLGIG